MPQNYFELNRLRWNLLPVGNGRRRIDQLLKLPDWWLNFAYNRYKIKWEKSRAWEYERYSTLFKDRNVLEIGGGMGYDGIKYSQTANSYTYAELNETQLAFIKRVAKLNMVTNAHFELMHTINHRFPRKYNAFYAHGVLHHVPFELAKAEFENIDNYLEPGTIAIFLMYPKQRWEHYGKPSFDKFGHYTDGGCPWTEWYDEDKITNLVGTNYKLLESKYWGWRNIEFVNFELQKVL